MTKATQDGPGAGLIGPLRDLQERLVLALDQQRALDSAQKTLAMYRFARPFLALLEARKRERGWLDFDDLIEKTAALLNDPAMAGWVLYRLDGQIDHILVDEAQDTSLAQWQVIASLAQEFTAGEGARDAPRTVFVVGDPKQSIYSFQGADPAAFSGMKQHFHQGFGAIGKPMQDLRLEYSFRSSPAVLELVDHALAGMEGLGDAGFRHHAFFADKPGRVDLWPVVEKQGYSEERAWFDTTDIAMPETHTRRLARQVAAEIARMLAQETLPGKHGVPRPVQPGDVLILVRGRKTGLFDALIRACKAAGLPVAGADRLKLGAEMAVKDLTALLRFLATPEDDLSLAAVLRSPICGLDEAALYALAQPRARGAYLWNELRERQAEHAQAFELLDDLRRAADFKRPFELIERALTRHRGRERLLARLGREAEEGIDALLAQALEYERAETPSLTGFLEWLEVSEIEIKRQMDAAGNLIRVMTVHGAKGLEAPIVFLPDCGPKADKDQAEFLERDGGVIWRPSKADLPQDLRDRADAARALRRAEEDRLLYVAVTRAANWLVVAAAGDLGNKGDSWYEVLEAGMARLGAVDHDFAAGRGKRYEAGHWPQQTGAPDKADTGAPGLPAWAEAQACAPEALSEILSPSDLGGAKALPGDTGSASEGEEAALRRGRLLHLLLEKLPALPPRLRESHALRLLAQGVDAVDEAQARVLTAEALALIEDPSLAEIFGSESLAEVEVTAALPELGGARIQGAIDRLVVSAQEVTAVDFKSNRLVPAHAHEVPEGLLRQIGAYMSALRQIYPDRRVRGAILWTETGVLMEIPSDLAARSLCLDDPRPAT
ncbi:MAG TPA: double-strand break repair helicase AddA [Aliiroseovarius sp.]|nr:double-strand break repair helicase AddA [Aliiroseovarius sp.]